MKGEFQMKSIYVESGLKLEEKRTSLLYLILVFFLFIGYEVAAFALKYAGYTKAVNHEFYISPYYFILFTFIPCLYLYKISKPFYIKYILLFGFHIFDFLNQFMSNRDVVVGGNIIEFIMVLFSPVFLSSRFFWIVLCITLVKYSINFLLYSNYYYLLSMLFFVFIGIITLIILLRIRSYVRALEKSHEASILIIIKNFMKILGLKNETIVDHSERVAHLCLIFVKKFKLVDEQGLNSFYFSCLLHDIGKIKFTDNMLAGKLELTNTEKELVKNHPLTGSNILNDLEDIEINLDVIKYHHEAWDGSGYPYGLKSTEIPVLAQVLSLANTFDSLTHSKSYRNAVSYNEAYQIIQKSDKFSMEIQEQFKQVYPLWTNEMIKYKAS
jgi:response regulator RpfG family c-di-GMP phosphodiesterase